MDELAAEFFDKDQDDIEIDEKGDIWRGKDRVSEDDLIDFGEWLLQRM